ncbi:hypothetical protein H3H54_08730 [Brachybacterium sp. Z12]|uniref:hypothetical protein n=1 Tax=Brachybacterium sp. Z12 TaxID=2759167 RepID=UPI00185F5EB6|nr:hypothetical protein [Brachybacterium sp. Z12]QNN81633.1 hypothetical protein H3H54_08730 [Brachybacterium sp. Z12]
MTSIMRRTVRGAAAGLGALAIVAGTAACGGLLGGDAEEDSPSVEEQDPAQDEGDDGADEEADPAETEEGSAESDGAGTDDADAGEDTEAGDDAETGDDADNDDAGGGETLGEEDLTKAGDRFYAFFEAIGNEDPEAACSLVIDYETGEPTTGAGLEKCMASFEEEFGADFDPSMMDILQREMIEASDSGDGSAEISVMGESTEMSMQKADDGEWYIVADTGF